MIGLGERQCRWRRGIGDAEAVPGRRVSSEQLVFGQGRRSSRRRSAGGVPLRHGAAPLTPTRRRRRLCALNFPRLLLQSLASPFPRSRSTRLTPAPRTCPSRSSDAPRRVSSASAVAVAITPSLLARRLPLRVSVDPRRDVSQSGDGEGERKEREEKARNDKWASGRSELFGEGRKQHTVHEEREGKGRTR